MLFFAQVPIKIMFILGAGMMLFGGLYWLWADFVKRHKTLEGSSPATSAAGSKPACSTSELAAMSEAGATEPAIRGPYAKTAEQNSHCDATRYCHGLVWLVGS